MQQSQLREHLVQFEWNKLVYVPIPESPLYYPVFSKSEHLEKCNLHVFVQGNIEQLDGKAVFLTIHDIGKTHMSFVNFVNSPAMAELRDKSIFLHVCVPGQQPGAKPMEDEYPTMDQMGEGLAQVLSKFNLSKCIVMGEGAGADIACRFAMKYHHLVTGLVLIHCTSTTHGILEHAKEILMNLRLDDGIMNQPAWNYLLTHRFGNHNMDEQQKQFIQRVKTDSGLNEKNLSRYIYSFAHRNDFTHELKEQMAKVDAVLITGGKSSHNDNVQHMFEHMNKSKTSMFVAENCVDLLEDAPDFLASALIMLCQRKGIFPDMDFPVGDALPQSLTCSNAVTQQHKTESNQFGLLSKCVPMN